jgi:murein L,D-transpeptidase YcbB/YkuD
LGLGVALLATAACTTPDPIPSRLEARLRSVVAAGRPEASHDDVEQALIRQLRDAPLPPEGGKNSTNPSFPTRETLAQFYEKNGHRLIWCDDSGKLTAATKTLLGALRRAGEHGLDPEDYALRRLDLLSSQIAKAPLDDSGLTRLADFDLLMTASFFRYASDLSTGRVHPDEIRNDWHTNGPELDPLTKLDEALQGDKLADLLSALPPPHPGYARLCVALKELRELEAAGGWPLIPEGEKLKLGSRGPRVALLRQRLLEPADANDRFDRTLAESVRRFQVAHGIEPDGTLGAITLNEMNVPVERRIRQIELNLERWRWIPRALGDPHVFVNIPGFDLALVRDRVPVWHTRIVVGKAFTPTPVFSDRIVETVINPPWNVPESIAIGEYLPELLKDKTALRRHDLRLLQGSEDHAREVDPTTVDWKALGEGEFPYRLRQDPGPNNALGRVKFQLTNEFNVYLHDTPTRALFGKSGRDLSHGCMRVEQPVDLARQLLGESSQHALSDALDQAEERHLPVKPAVPIHIAYLTAWVDDVGALRFSPDVYDFDGPQGSALDRVAARVSGGPASGAKEATHPEAQ